AAGAAVAHRVDGRSPRTLRRSHPGTARTAHPESRELDSEARRARAARPRANERQPAAGRSVQRRLDAGPELPVAAVPAQPGALDTGRAAVAHRREHVAWAG